MIFITDTFKCTNKKKRKENDREIYMANSNLQRAELVIGT